MEKVLIITYFFPPCNLTPSQRVYSWAKYLNHYGYYPTIVTRRWDYKISKPSDQSIKTPSDILHEKHPEYEVYYLPFKPGLKDRLYSKYGEHKYVILRKILSFTELIMQNLCLFFIPYRNLYKFSLQLTKKDKSIKKLVVTANPYILFKFAYKLNKKNNIKWIADYRDAWSNSEINNINRGKLYNLISKYDSFFEKKWVKTAGYLTSVSEPLARHINSLVNIKYETLYNGFLEEDFDNYRNEPPFEDFTITYVGTLFNGQKISLFLDAFKTFIDELKIINPNPKVKLLLPGLAFKKEINSMVDNLMIGYEQFYQSTERTEREEVLKTEVKSHLLLYVAWQGYNGITPSKIYEYLASESYILVAPSDNNVVDDIVKRSGCGICLNNKTEILNLLQNLYTKYKNGEKIKNNINNPNVKQFSRKLQVEKLAKLLSEL